MISIPVIHAKFARQVIFEPRDEGKDGVRKLLGIFFETCE
jgi:hypothetical protein